MAKAEHLWSDIKAFGLNPFHIRHCNIYGGVYRMSQIVKKGRCLIEMRRCSMKCLPDSASSQMKFLEL